MADKKISALETIVTVDTGTDLFPIVDSSAGVTKKITPTALKTALSLDNVNNTSDLNKPISTATQDALDNRVIENAPITAGTAAKITFDAKGLVTSGDSLDETDLPTGINANKIGTGVVSTTEFEYLNGVTSAIQTQINSKQATLVSGTNIKTINSTSLLGSGDITISANPSGVSGAIQFSNGSAFASDAAQLFWDDTNNRLGVGTNAPSATGHFKGSGSTSATTSLLVQNSSATESMTFTDDGVLTVASPSNTGSPKIRVGTSGFNNDFNQLRMYAAGSLALAIQSNSITFAGSGAYAQMSWVINTSLSLSTNDSQVFMNAQGTSFGKGSGAATSSIVEIASTTKGFLPPRMTTTQKNAIASPAAGLVLYDSTTNKLQCYNGSTWNDLF
jgi:hypothetical protein